MPSVAASPEALTPEWVEGKLRAAGVLGDVRVAGLEQREIGTGQMATNLRLELDYVGDAGGAPPSVVAKIPSSDPTSRATGVTQGAYLKEVRFYQQIQTTVGIRTPHCYTAEIDPGTGDFVLLLEDMRPAEQGDQIAGCSTDAAAIALQELARLHAPRWGDPELGALDWMSRPSPEAGQLLDAMYQHVWPGFVERYAHALSKEQLALAERLGRNARAWSTAAGAGPLTVTHGDYRLDNMLFGDADGGVPLAVVDWQTCGQGAGAADASYFLGASLLAEARRSNERKLIEDYHQALRAAGVDGYSLETCWEDYARFAFSGVVMAVIASMIVEQSDRGDAMFIAMATRHSTHALELGSERFLPDA